jgi:hypothetical protein
VSHVLRVVFVEMLHVPFQFVHGGGDFRIVEIRTSIAFASLAARGGFLQTFGHGEAAQLFFQLFVAAFGTGGGMSRIYPFGKEAVNLPAFRTGKFVNRHE